MVFNEKRLGVSKNKDLFQEFWEFGLKRLSWVSNMVSISSKTIHLEPQMHDNYYVCFPNFRFDEKFLSSRLEILGVYTGVTLLQIKWWI